MARGRRGSQGADNSAVIGRNLVYSGDIDDCFFSFCAENLLKANAFLDSEEAANVTKDGRRLILNSMGGDVYTCYGVVDLFEQVADLTTIACGSCMSAAVPIVAAGTPGQRLATKRTRFMVHPSWESFEDGRRMELDDLDSETREMRECEKLYAAIMARYCAHDYQWWYGKCKTHKAWYFDANTALQHGIIDSIIPDSEVVKISKPRVRRSGR